MAATDYNPGSMSELSAPQRQMLTDDVYRTIRDDLLAGQYEPGSWLNLDQLARRLKVSNTPIRQALTRLEAEGLVEKLPYRGFAVAAALDLATVEDIYLGRTMLEPAFAGRAAQKAPPEALDELDRLLRRIDVVIAQDPGEWAPGDVKACVDADETFHGTIARLGGNPVMQEMVAWLSNRLLSSRPLYLRGDAAAKSHAEHLVIFAALRDHDTQAAEDAMRSHLDCALNRLRVMSR